MSTLAPSGIRAIGAPPTPRDTLPEQASSHRRLEASSAEPIASRGPTGHPVSSCTHCGLGVPAALVQPGANEQFCCDACRLVYQTIHACGLDQYYAIRQRLGAEGRRAATSEKPHTFAEFDDPAFLAAFARRASNDGGAPAPGEPLRVQLLLEGVHCAACMWLVERLPRIEPGVRSARLDLTRAVVELEWVPARVRLSRVAGALARLGYRPHPVIDSAARDARRRQDREYLVRIGVAAACAGNAMLLAFALYSGEFVGIEPVFRSLFTWISVLISVVCLAWPGRVFLSGALNAIRARTWHLDMPIASALLIGTGAGVVAAIRGTPDIFADSLTMLVFLLLGGRWLLIRQQRFALDSVELLFSLAGGAAHLVEPADRAEAGGQGSVVRDVSVQSLRAGQLVEVRPQESFPVDGIIEQGHTTIDASILTGESRPRAAGPGDAATAGSINLGAVVRVRVCEVGRATRAGRMMATIEDLSRRRTPVIGSADRLAAPFVVGVASLALLTFLLHLGTGVAPALRHSIALMVATCPCAVALATPLVVTLAVGRFARRGVLIKGGDVFERLARPGTIVLDKTGTITTGRFEVLDWIGDPSLRPIVAEIQRGSTHPIAVALSRTDPSNDRERGSDGTGSRQADQGFRVEHRLGRGVDATRNAEQIRVGSPAWLAETCGPVPPFARRAVEGAAAKGHTPVVIARNGLIRAVAVLGDQIRDDAGDTIEALRSNAWRIAMLSGDEPGVVRAVASRLAIDPDQAWGGATPEEKQRRIECLQADPSLLRSPASAQTAPKAPEIGPPRRTSPLHHAAPAVVMVGDGVNDAPALARADVGIAVRGGAEASLAAADVYVGRGGLGEIATLIDASRRVTRSIRVCLAVALAYNAVSVTLAVAGLLSPLVAATMMPLSSMSVLAIAVRAWTVPGTDRTPARKAERGPHATITHAPDRAGPPTGRPA